MLPQKSGETWLEGEGRPSIFPTLLGKLAPARIQEMGSPGPGPVQRPVRELRSEGMILYLSDTFDGHTLVSSPPLWL